MTKRPRSFLEEEATRGEEPRAEIHFRISWADKLELLTHILKQRRPMADWLREAAVEKMARELEAEMHKATEPEEAANIADLLLPRK